METLTLDDGRGRVVVAPGAGAGLVSYELLAGGASVPLLCAGPPVPDPDDPFALGCNLLLPWSNRISGGGFAFDGTFHALEPNLAGEPFPIHGNAFQLPWRVERHDAASATLSLASDEPGPFRYLARVRYGLYAGALEVRLDLINRATCALPYGYGLHPWFPRTEGMTLQLHAREVRLEDERYLPAGRAAPEDVPGWDFRAGAPMPDGWINNAFTGWDGTARLEWPMEALLGRGRADGCADRPDERSGDDPGERIALVLSTEPALSTCIVHSPGEGAPFVCVEPVSHPVDSHHDASVPFEGLCTLAPGEALHGVWRLEPVRDHGRSRQVARTTGIGAVPRRSTRRSTTRRC